MDSWGPSLVAAQPANSAAYLTLHHEQTMAREQLLQSRFAPPYLTCTLHQQVGRSRSMEPQCAKDCRVARAKVAGDK